MKNLKKYKIVIFCGGKGTRIRELNNKIPKPLIRIKKKAIIERIMEVYYKQGLNNFILLSGYKSEKIEKYKFNKKFKIKVVFTGINSGTAERLCRIKSILKNENFFLTYGDTIGNFKLRNIISISKNKFTVSLCVYNYALNKGVIRMKQNFKVERFYEKNFDLKINAGYYFIKKNIFKYIKKKDKSFECSVMPRLAKKNKIIVSQILTKWLPIDTKQDYEFAKKRI